MTCLIRDKNRALVCRLSVDNKDFLPSVGRMLPNYRLTVSQVQGTHFKKIEVGGVSADRRPIVDRRLVDAKPLPNPKDSRAITKKKLVSYNFLPKADPKKQLKSHTKSADCWLTVSRLASLTISRQSAGSMSPRFK